jgi:hypothetical protein
MTDTDQLIQEVEHSRAPLIAAVTGLTEAQGVFRPSEGQWSVAEVLEHLYFGGAVGHGEDLGSAQRPRGQQGLVGRTTESGQVHRIDRAATWKAKEVAPPIVTPHIGGPIQFWLTATQSLRPLLADLGAELRNTNLEDVVFPHFLSGPLDGRQRVAFLRFHLQRHADQIARM